jgi:hypothetical protein
VVGSTLTAVDGKNRANAAPLWPPASLYVLPATIAGSTTSLIPSQDAPQQGALQSYAYTIGQGDNTYNVDIYSSHAVALQASQTASQQGQPLIVYTFKAPNPFRLWADADETTGAIMAGATVNNITLYVVYHGASTMQQSSDPHQWAPYARHALTIVTALIARTQSFHAPSDAARNAAFLRFVHTVVYDTLQCRQTFSTALNAYNAYSRGRGSAFAVSQSVAIALDGCRTSEGMIQTATTDMPLSLKPYDTVARIGMDWQSGVGAYREALGLMGSPINGGARVPSSYITNYITAGVTSFINAGNLTNQVKSSGTLRKLLPFDLICAISAYPKG